MANEIIYTHTHTNTYMYMYIHQTTNNTKICTKEQTHILTDTQTNPKPDFFVDPLRSWFEYCTAMSLFWDSPDREMTNILVLQVLGAEEALQKVLAGGYSLLDWENYLTIVIASQYTDSYGNTPFYMSKKGVSIMAAFGWGFRRVQRCIGHGFLFLTFLSSAFCFSNKNYINMQLWWFFLCIYILMYSFSLDNR